MMPADDIMCPTHMFNSLSYQRSRLTSQQGLNPEPKCKLCVAGGMPVSLSCSLPCPGASDGPANLTALLCAIMTPNRQRSSRPGASAGAFISCACCQTPRTCARNSTRAATGVELASSAQPTAPVEGCPQHGPGCGACSGPAAVGARTPHLPAAHVHLVCQRPQLLRAGAADHHGDPSLSPHMRCKLGAVAPSECQPRQDCSIACMLCSQHLSRSLRKVCELLAC